MRRLTATILACLISVVARASEELTPISDLQRGTQVTVSGMVSRITDEDEFRLTDQSGTVRVYIGPHWVPAKLGETVTVAGVVDSDLGPLELSASSLIRENGTIVTFDRVHQ